MKHFWIIGALLLASQAGAQAAQGGGCTTPDCTAMSTTGDKVSISEKPANYTGALSSTLTEDINVSIPAVVAMHLHETSWNVDLSRLDDRGNDCDCYRAGEHDVTTGRDKPYDLLGLLKASGTVWTGDGVDRPDNKYSFAGELKFDTAFGGGLYNKLVEVKRYPGIEYDTRDMSKVSWKGPIVCFNRKVVEKFTNSPKGWTFNVSLQGQGNAAITPGFPTLIVGDRVAQSGLANNAANPKKVEVLYNAATGAKTTLSFDNVFAMGSATKTTTGGWLDDYIVEALVFDGNETAGIKRAQVKFELVGQF